MGQVKWEVEEEGGLDHLAQFVIRIRIRILIRISLRFWEESKAAGSTVRMRNAAKVTGRQPKKKG